MGRAARVGPDSSPVRAGSTITAIPSALIPLSTTPTLTGPADGGPRDPPLRDGRSRRPALRRRHRLRVQTARTCGRSTRAPVPGPAGRSRSGYVRARRARRSGGLVRRHRGQLDRRSSSSNDTSTPLAAAPRAMPAIIRRSDSPSPSSMKRQRHDSRMLWVSLPSMPSSEIVLSIDVRALVISARTSGASRRPSGGTDPVGIAGGT